MCLVTRIVRWITLVLIKGLAASVVAFWPPALRARPVRPPRPRIAATAAVRVFKFFTSSTSWPDLRFAVWGGGVEAIPRRG
jgi:hypothetical protein